MSRKVNPVPKGYRTVTPCLVVRGVERAVSFYERVFDAAAGPRLHADDGERVAQVELKIGTSLVLLSDEMPEFGVLSPAALGATPVGQKVFLADPDAAMARAVDAGAFQLMAVTEYPVSERSAERLGRFVDPFGHVWTVAARVPASERKTPDSDAPEAGTTLGEATPAPAGETAGATGTAAVQPATPADGHA